MLPLNGSVSETGLWIYRLFLKGADLTLQGTTYNFLVDIICTVIRISLGTPLGRYLLALAICLERLNSQSETIIGAPGQARQHQQTIG